MSCTVRAIFGLACPKCRRDDHLAVSIRTWAALSGEGADAHHDMHEWDEESPCRCEACGFCDRVSSFRSPQSKQHKERKRL